MGRAEVVAKNPVPPKLARQILDEKLRFKNDRGPLGEAEDIRLEFPEDEPAGWPYYLAMLEVAAVPGAVAWVGWQLIAYYFIDAERFWPDNGQSLVPVVSRSANDSPRLGQLLSQWLCFAGSVHSPAVTALALEVLNRRFGWDLGPNLLAVRQSVRGGRHSVEYHELRSDFTPSSVRIAIVACFDPFVPSRRRVASLRQGGLMRRKNVFEASRERPV